MNDNKYIGIDFGTTNCCVSYTHLHPQQRRGAEPQVIDINGCPTVQNALVLGLDGKTLVAFGNDVFDSQAYLQTPGSVYRGYKLAMRESPEAQQCAALMFSQLYQCLCQSLNVKRLEPDHHEVVIGVPANWNEIETRCMLQAAAKGGILDASPVPEPMGVMLYHAFVGDISFGPNPEYDLVIDFGGGTTDFVILKMAAHWPTPQITHVFGDVFGGEDFDRQMLNFLKNRFWRGNNWTPRLAVQSELFARRFKERFSTAIGRGQQSYEQMCGIPRFEQIVRLSRNEFESRDFAGPLIRRFAELIHNGLVSSGLRPDQFRRIILSGGSSRWYFVESILRQFFKEAVIIRSALPEQTISKGLALYMVNPTTAFASPAQPEAAPRPSATAPVQYPAQTPVTQPAPQVAQRVAEPLVVQPLANQPSVKKEGPYSELINAPQPQAPVQIPTQTSAVPVPATITQEKPWKKFILTWGSVMLMLVFLNDMFMPVAGGVPLIPEETLGCGLPIWLTALIIAIVHDNSVTQQRHE